MPTDYNDWQCRQIEDEYDQHDRKLAQQEKFIETLEDELSDLLNENGFGDLYFALSGTPALSKAINAEAKARNPELFH